MVFPTNNGEPTSAPPCAISAMPQTWEKKFWQPKDTQAGLWKVSELAVALRSFISCLAMGLPLLWDPRGLYPKFYIMGFSQQVCSIVTVNPISLLFSISSHSILSLDWIQPLPNLSLYSLRARFNGCFSSQQEPHFLRTFSQTPQDSARSPC